MWVPTLTLQRKHKFRAGLSQVLSQSSIMAAHHKLATADSDATAFDSAKHTRDNTSPTESNFPELLYNGNGQSEHNKLSPTRKSRPRSYPPIIPPDHPNRTLVLCFDGTGNEFDADNSNIVQFVSLLKKGDSTQQLVYYQVRLIHFFFFFHLCWGVNLGALLRLALALTRPTKMLHPLCRRLERYYIL